MKPTCILCVAFLVLCCMGSLLAEKPVDTKPTKPAPVKSEPTKSEPAKDKPGEERMFDGIKFVWIPAGEFQMGSTKAEQEWAAIYDAAALGDDSTRTLLQSKAVLASEGPVHTVRITKGFWLSKYEVTQAQYARVMGSNPSHFTGSNHPVEQVSWDHAIRFCRKLSIQSGGKYRLPTEGGVGLCVSCRDSDSVLLG